MPNTFPFCKNFTIPSAYTEFLAQVTNMKEPRTYREAKQSAEWMQAMQTELEALEKIKLGF